MAAVTILDGATTAGVPTAWAAVSVSERYVIQVFGTSGTLQFSNDGVNPFPSAGSALATISQNGGAEAVYRVTGLPVGFVRFLPNTTQASVQVYLTSL